MHALAVTTGAEVVVVTVRAVIAKAPDLASASVTDDVFVKVIVIQTHLDNYFIS